MCLNLLNIKTTINKQKQSNIQFEYYRKTFNYVLMPIKEQSNAIFRSKWL